MIRFGLISDFSCSKVLNWEDSQYTEEISFITSFLVYIVKTDPCSYRTMNF